MLSKFGKGLVGLLLAVGAIAVSAVVFLGGIYYVGTGIYGFVDAFSARHGISQAYVYASPFAMILLWLGFEAAEKRLPLRAWRARAAAGVVSAIGFGLLIGVGWVVGIAGLLTGPKPFAISSETGASGRIGEAIVWALTHAPSLANPRITALIGLVIGLPMAVRSFWSVAPLSAHDGKIHVISRPRPGPQERVPTSTRPLPGRRPPPASPRTRPSWSPAAPVKTSKFSFGSGHVRAGIATGIATFASVSAGWNDSPKLFQLILSLLASAGTGTMASLQWRASSSASRK
ncbi:hypothetical protein [Actinoplanes solisilvae]|uniref:hypothetical protein n=1 Tax=Actinoplanes solisilvae TaxID=2486853 RepID=UPI000FDB0A5A|nr:hypothetical protein [Actinoplanes solisilvae]